YPGDRGMSTQACPTGGYAAASSAWGVIKAVVTPPRCQRSEETEARELRIRWMRAMGLGEDEIAESLRDDPPASTADEMRQLHALEELARITPTNAEFRKMATKY